ncbi:MAG: bifunctional ADP-dependent (S)-NAD(P)H-hydrate dehydratase/NAD(P)H-hydrate epimerase [Chloroflexota bacterium]|nr:MAG: bifunctional ADP-dependent (S)-NAD(P)H-hydrate dehydratase/NAD(P)H-hydrate epimerase [Chloroflexota bacterium]
MYIVTTQQMQAAEKAADAAGLSYEQMMENAGHAVAEAIAAHFDISGVRVLVLVGPGNNGGDGLVVARYLAQMGATVTVYVWQRRTDGDKNWALLDAAGVEKVMSSDSDSQAHLAHLLAESGVIVDALLGTGVSRPIEGSLAQLLDQVKTVVAERRGLEEGTLVEPARPISDSEFGPAVVAVDVPSGLNSDTGAVDPHTLTADLTVTLAAAKRGHILLSGPEVTGQLLVGDIGLTDEHYPEDVTLQMATPAKVAALLPPRPASAHKGTFGTALLVAGSMSYTGAAILAGQAATRSGAGLVTLAPPQVIHPIVASRLAEATYIPLPHAEGAIAPEATRLLFSKLDGIDALLIGPGLSQAAPTVAFLKEFLSGKAGLPQRAVGFRQPEAETSSPDKSPSIPPLIVDADALNILAGLEKWWQLLPPDCILTPHPGEMARLMGSTIKDVQARRLEIAGEMAQRWQQVVLLKGAHTVVAAPDGRMMVLPFANPALAKAGSGDVLAGVIVGLRAQGLGAFEAAVAGAYLHGLAGELARENLGVTGVIAGDLVGYLPLALRDMCGE